MQTARANWLRHLEGQRGRWVVPDSASRLWDRSLEASSEDEIRAMQGERLRLLVHYAYECIPFYRRRFDRIGLVPKDIQTVDDLPRIPITTREEMAEDALAHPPWGTYTAIDDARWRERGWQTFATSGTTAQPRVFRYTELDRKLWAWLEARAMWAMGARPGRDSALVAFGYGPHVWLWGMHYGLDLMRIPKVTAGGMDSRSRVALIDRYKPTILACTPSFALFLGNLATEMGVDPQRSSVRLLFCAGEPGFSVPATRRRLEEMWGAELHDFYGCTEASPAPGGYTCSAASEHAESAHLHLTEDAQIWEAVDPRTLGPMENGRLGASVVTNLMSEASPQLRFLVGDYVSLRREECGCERTHLCATGGFRGRMDDILNIRGVTLFPSAIEDVLRNVPNISDEYQIEIRRESELDVLDLRVEARSAADDPAPIAADVAQRVLEACRVRPVVCVVPNGTLPRTEFKAKRVTDLRT